MAAILPPAMLGILGGGQLGRMFAVAAKTMGYRVTVLAGRSRAGGRVRRPPPVRAVQRSGRAGRPGQELRRRHH